MVPAPNLMRSFDGLYSNLSESAFFLFADRLKHSTEVFGQELFDFCENCGSI